uniref:NADH dehydrogenase [ubiquinone] 1 beta subcomplex subunit 5, mitochondrial n=1 Tax=Plectus sambesii TaxID=2011161 RepID=A0A914W1D4_9BILA
MVVFSKLVAPAGTLLQAGNVLQKFVRHGGHASLFRKRPGTMSANRMRDHAHFYMIGLGTLPWLVLAAYVNIVYGPCELRDYPEDGSEPRFWQFERTVLRQWFVKHFGVSDVEHHERNLALMERNATLSYWRKIEQRVRHLQQERWDYKAWYYAPVKARWVDQSELFNRQMTEQREYFAHYSE